MKIGFKPPSVPTLQDLAKTPTPAGPVPLPTPRVLQGVSSFTGGVERRFSVQFMKGIEARLKLTGLPQAHVQDLTRRFGTMGRAELDREGRVAEALLAGPHPKDAMAVYGFMAKLGSLVTPGGHRISPNVERSWTITPPDGDPLVLPNRAGASLRLEDGSSLAVIERAGGLLLTVEAAMEKGLGVAGDALTQDHAASLGALKTSLEDLSRAKQAFVGNDGAIALDIAVGVGSVPVAVILTTIAIVATTASTGAAASLLAANAAAAVVACAVTIVATSPQLMKGLAEVADAMGFPDAANALREGSAELEKFLSGSGVKPALTAALLGCAVVGIVCSAPLEVGKEVAVLLARAGQSAAPSRRNDPDAERAAVLLATAHQGSRLHTHQREALAELTEFAAKVRGSARDATVAVLTTVLESVAKGGGSLRQVLDGTR